jgi:hypothetical protein|tara:strand:+ start:2566 stop:2727 length:162 start_codon:yes stop_codon:yes gene_type:complete
MYSMMDEILRLNGADSFNHNLDRARTRAGVRARPRNHDVDSFLSACGLKAKRK